MSSRTFGYLCDPSTNSRSTGSVTDGRASTDLARSGRTCSATPAASRLALNAANVSSPVRCRALPPVCGSMAITVPEPRSRNPSAIAIVERPIHDPISTAIGASPGASRAAR